MRCDVGKALESGGPASGLGSLGDRCWGQVSSERVEDVRMRSYVVHTMLAAEEIEYTDEDLEDPFPLYARLRAMPGLPRQAKTGYFLVARYQDVRDAAMRPDDFSSRITELMVRDAGIGLAFEYAMQAFGPVDVLAVDDAPRHPLHRKLTMKHFGRDPVAAAINAVRPRAEARIRALVDRGGGEFMAALAGLLPAEVALAALGFPIEDAPTVKRLSDRSVALLSGVLPRHGRGAAVFAALGLYAYAAARFSWLAYRGGSHAPLGDAIVQAVRRRALSVREATSIVMQLLIAGSDSTTSLLGSTAVRLATDPALCSTVRQDLAQLPTLIEEVLRLESPFQGHFRLVRQKTQLAGEWLRPGDRLMLLWASANRDESVFPDADILRLDRRRGDRPHLSFGHGIHLCLGANLARAVSRMAIEALLREARTLRLAPEVLRHRPSQFVRTYERVPLIAGR